MAGVELNPFETQVQFQNLKPELKSYRVHNMVPAPSLHVNFQHSPKEVTSHFSIS